MVKGPTKGARSERKGTLGNHSYIHKDARGSFPIWRSHDAQRHKHQKDHLVGFPLFLSNSRHLCNCRTKYSWCMRSKFKNLNNYQILMNFGCSIRSFAFQRIELAPLWTQLFLLDLARWRLREAYTHTVLVDGGFGWRPHTQILKDMFLNIHVFWNIYYEGGNSFITHFGFETMGCRPQVKASCRRLPVQYLEILESSKK